MKRGGYIKRRPKRRKAAPMRAMAKDKKLGRMAVSKGPARDAAHLAKVRQDECVASWDRWAEGNIEAHHVRCIAQRSLGKRVSDYLTVPLCRGHHARLHKMKEEEFWLHHGIDPAAWIAQFSAEGAAEMARLGRPVKEAR